MTAMIFINYRRSDTGWTARTVSKLLTEEFTSSQLFIDVDLRGGVDFVHSLEKQMAECDAMVSLIGQSWLSERDEAGGRRLDNPDDWVRIELETALRRGVCVIPVLVDGAVMPHEDQLPETLKMLARRQALRMTHEHFAAEVQNLIKAIKLALSNAEEVRQRETEVAQVRAKEEERRKQEEVLREVSRLREEKRQIVEEAHTQAARLREEARRVEEEARTRAAQLEAEAVRLGGVRGAVSGQSQHAGLAEKVRVAEDKLADFVTWLRSLPPGNSWRALWALVSVLLAATIVGVASAVAAGFVKVGTNPIKIGELSAFVWKELLIVIGICSRPIICKKFDFGVTFAVYWFFCSIIVSSCLVFVLISQGLIAPESHSVFGLLPGALVIVTGIRLLWLRRSRGGRGEFFIYLIGLVIAIGSAMIL